MKYKTLFRLSLKFVGVICIARGIPATIGLISWTVWEYLNTGAVTWSWYFTQTGAQMSEFLVGLYLFFGGEFIVNFAIPSNRRYCHECGYMLPGHEGGVCAECGTAYPPEAGASDAPS